MKINNNIERLELLLSTKAWEQLSPDDKSMAIQELGSEEQYVLMRKIGQTLVSKGPDLFPDPKILETIAAAFREQHKPAWQRALEYRVPAYTLLIPLILLVAAALIPSKPEASTILTSNVESPGRDTLYVKQAPDTVVVERTIVRYIEKKSLAVPVYTIVKTNEKDSGNDGVNMKENEELEKLLVSGS
jgi:hypothetical protein